LDCSWNLIEAESVSTETPAAPVQNFPRDLNEVVGTAVEIVACSPELLPMGAAMQTSASTKEKKANGNPDAQPNGNADAQPLPPCDSMFSTIGYGECLSSQGRLEGLAAINTSKISRTEAIPPEESLVMTQSYKDTELSCENETPQREASDPDSSMLLTQSYSPEMQDRNTSNVDMDTLLTQEYVAPAQTDDVLPTQDWRGSATCSSGSAGLDARGGGVRKAGTARCSVIGRRLANLEAQSYVHRGKVAIEQGVALAPFGAPVGCQSAPITVPLTQDSPGAILLGYYDPAITVQLSQGLPPLLPAGASDICAYSDGTMSGGPSDAVEEMLTQVYTAPGMDLDLQAMDAGCKGKVGSVAKDLGNTMSASTKSWTASSLKGQKSSHLLPPAALKVNTSKVPSGNLQGQAAWSARKSLPELFKGYDFAAAPVRDVLDDSDDEKQMTAGKHKRGGKIAAQPALIQKEHGHVRRRKAIPCSTADVVSARPAGVFGGRATTDSAALKPCRSPIQKSVPKKRERVITGMTGNEEELGGSKKTKSQQQQQQQQQDDLQVAVPVSPKRKRGRPKKSQTQSPTGVSTMPGLEVTKERAETPSRMHGSFHEQPAWTPPKRRRLHGKQRPHEPTKPVLGGLLLEKQQQDAVQNGGKAVADKAYEDRRAVEATTCGATVAAIESGESVMSPLEIFRSLVA